MTSISDHSNKRSRISVIIPCTRDQHIDRIRRALDDQEVKADEVIVVRDTDRKGVSWARNVGISKSSGELILFLDDDCVPPSDWINTMVSLLDGQDIAFAGQGYIQSDPLLADIDRRRKKMNINPVFFAGGNLIVKRKWLDKLYHAHGFYFNESMRQSQDHELVWRLEMVGGKWAQTQSKPLHLRRVSFGGFLMFKFHRGIGISNLRKVQKFWDYIPSHHQSLAWDEKRGRVSRMAKVIWLKLFGPLDYHNFSSVRNYCTFWLGEKMQIFGFIYGRMFVNPYPHTSPRDKRSEI